MSLKEGQPMATVLDVDDLPADVRTELLDRAVAHNRTPLAELKELVTRELTPKPATPPSPTTNRNGNAGASTPPGEGTAGSDIESIADAPNEADTVIYAFLRPLTGIPIRVEIGGERHPALPIILEEAPE
jgi:hypothetical protein